MSVRRLAVGATSSGAFSTSDRGFAWIGSQSAGWAVRLRGEDLQTAARGQGSASARSVPPTRDWCLRRVSPCPRRIADFGWIRSRSARWAGRLASCVDLTTPKSPPYSTQHSPGTEPPNPRGRTQRSQRWSRLLCCCLKVPGSQLDSRSSPDDHELAAGPARPLQRSRGPIRRMRPGLRLAPRRVVPFHVRSDLARIGSQSACLAGRIPRVVT